MLFLILRHFVFPFFRQDRQIAITPSGVLFPVGLWLCQLQKVPHAPAYQITAASDMATEGFSAITNFIPVTSISYSSGLFRPICFVLGFIVSFSCICCRWLESCSTTPFFWLSHTRQGLRWFSLPDLPAGCFGQSR